MGSIEILQADITKIKAEAIVNAANSSLLGGGGVDGAIHRQGGPEILEACKVIRSKQGGCRTGEAVWTTAGKLSAKYVIHTVGPVWSGHDQEEKDALLLSCYKRSLEIAETKELSSIAFPNISTGVFHFPKERAAKLVLNYLQDYFRSNPTSSLKVIKLVCYDEENYQLYKKYLSVDSINEMKIAVFPGSFDPITIGHVDLVKRALPLFDKIIVAIGINSQKKYLFTLEERLAHLETVFGKEEKVEVQYFEGLTAHFSNKMKADYLIRGLRNASDFDYEKTISQLNTIVGNGIETIFLISQPAYSHISSTIVREIIKGKGDASPFLPPELDL